MNLQAKEQGDVIMWTIGNVEGNVTRTQVLPFPQKIYKTAINTRNQITKHHSYIHTITNTWPKKKEYLYMFCTCMTGVTIKNSKVGVKTQ